MKVQVKDDNVLVISGERKHDNEKEGVKYLLMERQMEKLALWDKYCPCL